MNKNPFRILGLDINSLTGLKTEQLLEIVKKQFLNLQKIHHPDKGGNAKKSVLLNWAIEELSDAEKLITWMEKSKKNNRIAVQRQKTEFALQSLKRQKQFSLQLYKLMFEHIKNNDDYIDLLMIGGEGLRIWRDIDAQARGAYFYGINDEAETEAEKKEIHRQARKKLESRSFLTLTIENGLLVETDEANLVKKGKRLLVGVISQRTIRTHFNGSSETIYRFLKTFCPEDQGQYLALENKKSGTSKEILSRLSPQRFLKLMPFLSLEMTPESWLFSMVEEEGEYLFLLEGRIST
jgi:hypothetical protein